MLLSFIVPVYNNEQYIIDCLESINKIKSDDFECIVVDDGSTDGTNKLCSDYVLEHKNFRLITVENGGVARARNIGIDNATGDFVTFVDSDDIVHDIDLEFLTDENIYSLNMTRLTGQSESPISFKNKSFEKNFISYPVYMNSVCNKFFRRELLNSNSIRFVDGQFAAEDQIFVVAAIIKNDHRISYLDKNYYIYRVNDESSTQRPLSVRAVENYYVSYLKLEEYCNSDPQNDYKKLLRYQRLRVAILFLINIETYDVKRFRSVTKRSDIWNYGARIDFTIISFFAQWNIRFVPNFYIFLKKKCKK